MRPAVWICAISLTWVVATAAPGFAQLAPYPQSPSLPPGVFRDSQVAAPPVGEMIPFNPATSRGMYPATTPGSPLFDPYATRPSYQNPGYQLPGTSPMSPPPTYAPPYGSIAPYNNAPLPGTGAPVPGTGAPGLFGNPNAYPPYNGSPGMPGSPMPGSPMLGGGFPSTSAPPGGYPNTLNPGYPGIGQSGPIGNYNGLNNGVYPPSAFPNTAPPSLFPTSIFDAGQGGLFGGLTNWLGGSNPYGYGYGPGSYSGGGLAPGGYGGPLPNGGILAPGVGGASPYGYWNPPGTLAGTWPGAPQFIRFFQGPRIRHTFIYGENDQDALQINDTDVSLAFAWPNFLFSTQPLYILPSFSLHQWDGPNSPAKADLPSKAYSAFLDTGWQSDPMRLLGAELGVRVGVFSDFETFTSDSLRVMGRGLARMRLTPTATLKGGVVYLDRNRVKLLPAGGILWQPNPGTRFDLFFPEPKLAHYLNTIGTYDTWWYVGGYYGGGAWTVKRTNGTKDSIDINDIRLTLGLEWGRNDQLRDGRRVGFMEVGYVFNRELLYDKTPADNLDLADSFVIRAGLGY